MYSPLKPKNGLNGPPDGIECGSFLIGSTRRLRFGRSPCPEAWGFGSALRGYVVDGRRRGIFFDGGDAVIAGFGALVKLAGTDDLVIGRFKVEHGSAVVALFALVIVILCCVLFYRLNPTRSRGLLLVHLTGQDNLSICGPEMEVVITVFRLTDFELTCHRSSWLMLGGGATGPVYG